VNGRVTKNPDHWIETGKDKVHFDGRPIRSEKRIYIAFNKPTGVVTSHGDTGNRPTVYDYLKKLDRWVFPVGRLDMDTSGLLILTNDTDFGERPVRTLQRQQIPAVLAVAQRRMTRQSNAKDNEQEPT